MSEMSLLLPDFILTKISRDVDQEIQRLRLERYALRRLRNVLAWFIHPDSPSPYARRFHLLQQYQN